jgi:hypothetical protein
MTQSSDTSSQQLRAAPFIYLILRSAVRYLKPHLCRARHEKGTGTTGRCAPDCLQPTDAGEPKGFDSAIYAVTSRVGAAQHAMFSVTYTAFRLGPSHSPRVAGLQAEHQP